MLIKKTKKQNKTLILPNLLNYCLKKLKMFEEKRKKRKTISLNGREPLTYLFVNRDRCVGVSLSNVRVIRCLSRVTLGGSELAAAAVLLIRLAGGTSVTAVTCLVRVF